MFPSPTHIAYWQTTVKARVEHATLKAFVPVLTQFYVLVQAGLRQAVMMHKF